MSKEALDEFGQLLMQKVRDLAIDEWQMIADGRMSSSRARALRERISSLGGSQEALLKLVPEVVDTVLHHLLEMLDESKCLEISVHTPKEDVKSLRDSSDGLAGELYSRNGWIARFSRLAK